MGFAILEMAGLDLFGVAFAMQIASIATLKWVISRFKDVDVYMGIFKKCVVFTSVKGETCSWRNLVSSDKEGSLNAVRAMTLLAVAAVLATIILIVIFKLVLKRSPKIFVIVLGIFAALCQSVAVAVFAIVLKPESSTGKFGASFYVACISIGAVVIGTVFSATGTYKVGTDTKTTIHVQKDVVHT